MRLATAFDAGLQSPESATAWAPPVGYDMSGLKPDILHSNALALEYWRARGFACPEHARACEMGLVCLPRFKVYAKALIAEAAATSRSWVVVDGQKTDGIESVWNDLRKRVEIGGTVTKAHGRLFWFRPTPLEEWQLSPSSVDGLRTHPALFSADRIDLGSKGLSEALPATLAGRVADFGAGWGYLTRAVLSHEAVTQVDAIEIEKHGIDAMRENFDDPRLNAIWGDATVPRRGYDAIVMNPPFHQGRSNAPSLGQAFIRSAAQSLTRHGKLWMVANRHLPYEATLNESFAEVQSLPPPEGFKLFEASRPRIVRA
ncbi:MAG: methyltransferase [Pseudomonadota bacterium]